MQPLQLFFVFRESSAKPTLLFQYVLLLLEKYLLVSNNCHSRAIEFPKINPSNRYNESRRTKSIELLVLEKNEIEVCLTDWRRWWQCSQNSTRKKNKETRKQINYCRHYHTFSFISLAGCFASTSYKVLKEHSIVWLRISDLLEVFPTLLDPRYSISINCSILLVMFPNRESFRRTGLKKETKKKRSTPYHRALFLKIRS